jgi:dipeptidyl aminopeptidase/acylaminoacyl peptidase
MTDHGDLARLWASVPRIYTVHASGDGRWAFWSWEGLHENAEIYCAPTDGTGAPTRLTVGTDHFYIRDVNHDGSLLILAQSPDSCEHDHLVLLDRASGDLTPLTPVQRDHYVYGGVFSPDGKSISYIADYDFETKSVVVGGWLYRQDLATGTRTVLFRTPDPFGAGTRYSPDGRNLMWLRHRLKPGGAQIWVIGADGSHPRELVQLGEKSDVRGAWLDDDRIVLVADGPVNDRVGTVSLATGQIRWLIDEAGFNPQEVIAGQGGAFACHAYRQSTLRPVIFDADGDPHPLPNRVGRHSLLPLATLPDGGWLAEAYDADAPHELVRILPHGDCLTLASAPDVDGRTFVRPTDMQWSAPDGTEVQGWLYQPIGPSKGLIVYVHGGPTWHSEDWQNPKIGFWVQLGYTVLDPNYRGSTGFGMAYREAVKDDGWGGREQGDIRAGIEALIDKGLAEKGKIAVIGNSYGGFSSWFAITRHADLVTAAIPMCGMYRLDIDYAETEMPWGRAYSEEMMGGTPEEFPEKYANASPGNFIAQIRGHVMIVHGLADSNVGPENTHTAIRELTAAGIPHEALLFPDEGHGVTRQGNLATYLERSAQFLDRAFREGMR